MTLSTHNGSTPRVLQILGDSAFGGGSYHVLMLSLMLREKGLSIKLLSTDETTAAEFAKKGISVLQTAIIMRDVSPLADLKALYRLWRFLSKNPFDIVHTHTSKPGFVGRLAARMAGVPIIIHTSHRFAFDVAGSKFRSWLFLIMERLAGRWTSQLLVVSRQNYRMALDHKIAPEAKITYIPNFIDAERFDISRKTILAKKAELGLESDSRVVGMVARLHPPKLPADFVKACAILSRRWPSTRFLLVGDGPQRGEIESLVEQQGLNGQLIMTGFRRDIPEMLAVLDVFVLPTLWEGMSISILEAMAAGKPIVTTDIEPNREILRNGESAILVSPGAPKELAAAVDRLLDDPAAATALGATARRRAVQTFGYEQLREKIWNVYSSLIGENPPPN